MALPEPQIEIPNKTLKRFWAKVNIGEDSKCWEWLGAKSSWGYGSFGFKKKHFIASRLSWMIANGRIPNGMIIMHSCDNPACVNPDHLHLGTHQDNTDDKVSKGRHGWVSGDSHYSRTSPERLARGDRNGSRTHPESIRRGSNHHASKLSASDVLEIRKMYSFGITSCDIAQKFNLSASSAHRAATGRTWKHLPML